MKFGSLNLLDPSGPARASTGIAFTVDRLVGYEVVNIFDNIRSIFSLHLILAMVMLVDLLGFPFFQST